MSAAPDFDGGVAPYHDFFARRGEERWTCPRCAGRGWVRAGEWAQWAGICPACRGSGAFTEWTLAVALAGRVEGREARKRARVAWYRRIRSVLDVRTIRGRPLATRSRTAVELLERLAEVFACE